LMALSIQETSENKLTAEGARRARRKGRCPRNMTVKTLTSGIVHIGVGNFHRAHLAWYVHRLMQQGKALDWAIIGAGVRAQDSAMRERLLRQDFLTYLDRA
jgi:mannitol-1-phosphate/altronate dehydrogenase